MENNTNELPFRQGVHAYIFDKGFKNLFIVKHLNAPVWSMPGGGLEGSETPLEAVKREIKEELGIDINILFESVHIRKYKWTPEFQKVYFADTGVRYQGQEKRQFVAEFIEDKKALVVKQNEIEEYLWVPLGELEAYFSDQQEKLESIKRVLKEVEEYKNSKGL